MTEEQDDIFIDLYTVVAWIRNVLAAIGAAATCAAIGLYHSGFFTWLFSLKP